MPSSQRSLLAGIERDVLACRPVALRYFGRPDRLRLRPKADRSPVTAADHALEERLRRAIARRCPGETIIGEEFGASGRDGQTYWTIDPIDGTRAFSRGLPSWGILVGRVERGRPALGVCDFPALGVTLAVAPGVPAYERAKSRTLALRRARPAASLRETVIFHGGADWWAGTPYRRGFARLISRCFLERAYGDCYGYLWMFRGCADAVIDYGVKVWDMAPLAALAAGTGRAVVDARGRPGFHGPSTVTAHPSLARLIVRTLTH
jgi:fructose-1,6-bisphosphatase/inositol monophosphatase family enzyme